MTSPVAPPPGFELDTPGTAPAPTPVAASAGAAMPPPPPGFEMDGAPQGEWQRGAILPVETNEATKKIRPAVPGVIQSVIDAVMLPGKAAKGEDVTMDDVINAAGLVTPGLVARPGAKVMTEAGAAAFPRQRAIPKPAARALSSDGLLPEQVAGKLRELGPDAVLADLGPNLRAQAAAVATVPGAGQKQVVDTLTKRKLEAPKRLRGELDDTLGPAPIPGEVKAELKEHRKLLGPEYEAALAQASPVDTSALATSLDKEIPKLRGDAQTAVSKVRKMLDRVGGETAADPATIIAAEMDPAKRRDLVRRHLAGETLTAATPLDTDPRVLFETRKAIDGLIGSTSDNNVRRVLTDARKNVDDMLGASAPGIKDVDAKFSGVAREGKAFDRGQTVLDSGRESPRPRELQAEVDKANGPHGTEFGPSNEAARLSQGARAEIDRIVGTNLNDRAALNSLVKGEGDWNHDRLVTLFGKEKTDRIYKVLENERAMAETENLALAGSKTAAVTAAQKDVTMTPAAPGALQAAGDLHFGSAARNLKNRILGGVAERRQAGANQSLADTIMSKDPLQSGVAAAPGYGYSPANPIPAPLLIDAIMQPDTREKRQRNAKAGVKTYQDRVY